MPDTIEPVDQRFEIYCHTCRTTGLKYVGLTKYTMEQRWECHLYDALARDLDGGGCLYFHNAIRKYGEDDFDHELLEVAVGRPAVNAAEVRWIATLGTQTPNGYNISPGGGTGPFLEETRERMSKAHAAWWKTRTPEQRSEWARRTNEVQTPEERSDRQRRANAAMTIEERSARAQRGNDNLTPEQRAHKSEAIRARWAALSDDEKTDATAPMRDAQTSEQLAAAARKSNEVWLASTDHDERSRVAKHAQSKLTPEQRSDRIRRGNETRGADVRIASARKASAAALAKSTPEERSARQRLAAAKSWETRRAKTTEAERSDAGRRAREAGLARMTPEERSEAARKGNETRKKSV